jgi:hypothetical protein
MKRACIEYGCICVLLALWNIFTGSSESELFYGNWIFRFVCITGILWFFLTLLKFITFEDFRTNILTLSFSILLMISGATLHECYNKPSYVLEYLDQIGNCPQAEWSYDISYYSYDSADPASLHEKYDNGFYTGTKSNLDFHLKLKMEQIRKREQELELGKTIVVGEPNVRLFRLPKKWLMANNLPLEYFYKDGKANFVY